MAGNKIGVILAVDGEREFRDAMQKASSAVQASKAELKAIQAEYDGNANSLKALTAKQEALTKQQGKVKSALQAAKAGYENARKAVADHTKAVEDTDKKIKEAESELNRLKTAFGEGSDSVKKQEQALEDLNKEQEENKQKLQLAETCMNKWDKKVQTATADEKKNSRALDENERYMDEAKHSTDQCAKSIDEFGKKTKTAAEKTEEFKQTWGSAFKGAVANAALDAAQSALGALGDKAKEAAKYVVDVGSSFEAGMSQVEAISGASGAQLEALSEKAKELGASTKFSASEAADAFNYMAMAGWDTEDMLNGIDGIMSLAAASGEDLATTSDIVTDALTAMGYSAGDAGRLADVMAAASSNANTNVGLMGSTFQYAAPIVGALGYSMEDTAVAIGLMANAGIKGDKAGTALRAMLTRLSAPPKECAAEMDKLGISLTNSNGEMKSLDEVMRDLRTAFGGLSESEQTAAAKHIAGANAMSGLLAIVNAAPSDFEKLTDAVKNSDGAAQDMAATMQDNLQGKLTTMNSALEGLGIAAYDYVDGPLKGVVEGVTDVINGLTDAITPQKTALDGFIEDVQASNEAVEKSLEEAQSVLDGYEADATKLDAYKTVLQGVAEQTELTEFQKYEVSKIVNELADEVPELSQAWDEEAGVLRITAEEVGNLIDAYSNAAKQEAYTKAMKASSDALIEAAINVAKADAGVKKAQEEVDEAFKTAEPRYNNMTGLLTTMGAEYDAAEKRMESATKAQEEATKLQGEAQEEYDLTRAALADLGAQFDEAGNLIVDSTNEATDSTKRLAEAADQIDPEVLEELGKAAEDMRSSVEGSMQSVIDVFSDFEPKAAESLDVMIERLQKQQDALSTWSDNMSKLAEQIGGEMGEGISQEFYDYLAEMGPEGANLVQELVDDMEAGGDKFSTLAAEWQKGMDLSAQSDKISEATSAGKAYVEAMEQGMTAEATARMAQVVEQLIVPGIQAAKDKVSDWLNAGEESGSNYGSGVGSKEGEASSAGSELGLAGVGAVNAYTGEWNSVGSNSAGGFISGMRGRLNEIISTARSMVRDALNAAKAEAEIKSPSRKWKREVGEMLSKGMAAGLRSAAKDPENAAREVSDSVYDKATAWLEKKKKAMQISASAEKAYWKSVEATAKAGVAAYQKQAEKAAAAVARVDAKEDRKLAAKINKNFGVSRTETKTTGSGKNKKTETVRKDAQTYYSEIYSAAKKYLDNFEVVHDVSLQQEQAYWTQLKTKLKAGSQAWFDAQKQLNSVNEKLRAEREKQQANSLDAQEAYIKKRTYQGKMDTETELAFWKEQIKGYKAYSEEWYEIQDKIVSLQREKREEREAVIQQMLSDSETYVAHRQILGKMDTKQELAYWQEQISNYKKYSDQWYAIQEKINNLQTQDAAEEQAAFDALSGKKKIEAYEQQVKGLEKQLKKLKKNSKQWWALKKEIAEIQASITEEQASIDDDRLSQWEKTVDRKVTLEEKDEKWELSYWKSKLKLLDESSDAYLTVYKKIKSLEESINNSREDPAEVWKQRRQEIAKVQSSILSKYKTYYKVSSKAEMQYWDIARKQFKEGTDERIEADQAYFDAAQDYYDQRRDLDKQYAEDAAKIREDEKDGIEELNKAYQDGLAQRKTAILKSFDLFKSWDNEGYTKDALLYNAKTQIEGLRLWEAEITALRKKNLPEQLMEQLEEMGPEATANIYSLNRMTNAELNEWVKLWEQKNSIAERQAAKQSEDLLRETQDGIAKAHQEANSKLAELTAEYQKNLAEVETGISDGLKALIKNARKTGEDAVAGLIAGLTEPADVLTPYDAAGKVAADVSAQLAVIQVNAAADGKAAMEALALSLSDQETIRAATQGLYDYMMVRAKNEKWANVGKNIGKGVLTGFKKSTEQLNSYYATWESQWRSGLNRLNKLTGVTVGTQKVVVDTGNIAGILSAVLASVTAIQSAVNTGGAENAVNMTRIVDMLAAAVSGSMASTSYRASRGMVK